MRKFKFLFLALPLIFTACSGDDASGGDNSSNFTCKITVTINNVSTNDDFVNIAVAGASESNGVGTWKINNVEQTGQGAVGLTDTDFVGGTTTYVIESVGKLSTLSNAVQIINFGAPLQYTYKIEKNGTVIANDSGTLSTDGADYTKQFNF